METVPVDLYILPVMLPVRFLHDAPTFQSKALSIRGIGIREAMPPCFIERPQGTGDYLFMLFYDPVQFGPERRWLAPDTMAMWDTGSPHFYGNPQRRWVHSWVHCDGEAVGEIRAGLKVPCGGVLQVGDPSVVDRYLLEAHAEIRRSGGADPIVVRNVLENLVRTATRPCSGSGISTAAATFDKMRIYIDLHYPERLTLGHLADHAAMTPRHFCTEFRRHIGLTPMAYLCHRRLQTAAVLVRGTNVPLGEVGRRVGFPDAYHFSKRFKARFGVAPLWLRRSTRVAVPPNSTITLHNGTTESV